MAMPFEVIEATYVGHYTIHLKFADGSAGNADLSNYPNEQNVFRLFLDLDYFQNFRIEYGTLVWGEGELDLAPEALYSRATGKPVTFRQPRARV